MENDKIYLDVCCFNRPYDDLSNSLIRLESEAVLTIIDHFEQGKLTILGSDVLVDEINRIADKTKLEKVMTLYLSSTSGTIELCDSITARASELVTQGVKPFDALHVASAEYEKADIFLSTDKRLLNAAKRIGFNVNTSNPAVWLLEVLVNEQ